MSSFEELAKRLTKEGEGQTLPGVAAIVADDTGAIRYSKSFGSSFNGPVTVDSTMWVASCTKLLATISVLQCVEKGLIKLDEPVESILPEMGDKDLLYGFDDETKTPLMKKAEKKITMRHLLTHTSGLGYDTMDPMLIKMREYQGQEPTTGTKPLLIDELNYPVVFEPGEGFTYGVGIDWAGRAVERVNNNMRLEEYMRTNIWEPLGMTKTTFNPVDHPAVQENMAAFALRVDGNLQHIPHPLGTKPVVDDCGGSGIFTCAADYIKVLISLLRDDGKLLKSETVADIFKPHIADPKPLNDILQDPAINLGMTLGMEPGKTYNWGLSGLLAMEDTPGRRSDGTMTWCGVTNPAWWIDRKRKTCGFMGTQLLPWFDPQAISLFGKLESMAWETFGKS